MKLDFTDRIVAITGAAGNLGVAAARAFQSAGAKLALIDRSSDRLPQLFPDLAASPDHLFAPPTDVTNAESVKAAIDAALARFGRIDVLVNTAGGYRAGTPLHETSLEDWDFMLNLNARSVFLTCQAVIPPMLRQNYGRIINISSRAALGGDAYHAAYSVSKTAVVRLTESMAAELKDYGINVNCVMPGLIDTPQNRAAIPDADFSRWVAPDAIVDVILFLACDGARAIHGAAIPVYGRG
jgi:NAD(P)-dependent dehydrogenase (short-subunit alcohol dehydrogenase family)